MWCMLQLVASGESEGGGWYGQSGEHEVQGKLHCFELSVICEEFTQDSLQTDHYSSQGETTQTQRVFVASVLR